MGLNSGQLGEMTHTHFDCEQVETGQLYTAQGHHSHQGHHGRHGNDEDDNDDEDNDEDDKAADNDEDKEERR